MAITVQTIQKQCIALKWDGSNYVQVFQFVQPCEYIKFEIATEGLEVKITNRPLHLAKNDYLVKDELGNITKVKAEDFGGIYEVM